MGDGPHVRRSLHSPPHLRVQFLGGECSLVLPNAEVGLAHVPYLYLSLVVTTKSGRDVTFSFNNLGSGPLTIFVEGQTLIFGIPNPFQSSTDLLLWSDDRAAS